MFLLHMKPTPDDLDHLLHEWNSLPAPDGRLAEPVWQRIAADHGRTGWFGNMTLRLYELDLRFTRPQAIAAVIAFGLLVGVGLAELQTHYNATQADAEMSARYLSLLDVNNR
jgi:hypothetical protein